MSKKQFRNSQKRYLRINKSLFLEKEEDFDKMDYLCLPSTLIRNYLI